MSNTSDPDGMCKIHLDAVEMWAGLTSLADCTKANEDEKQEGVQIETDFYRTVDEIWEEFNKMKGLIDEQRRT